MPDMLKKTPKTESRYIPVIVFLLCFLLYGNTLLNGYVHDDDIYVTKNTFIRKGFSAFKDIFNKASLYGVNKDLSSQYRPLTLLNFMAEVSIFGLNPHVNHFFNVLFFASTVVLLYFFLQKILKNYNRAIILGAVLLFAFHPIHTEVVANIKSRDEILGLLFGLFSFYFLMLHIEQVPKQTKGIVNNKSVNLWQGRYYWFSVAAFFTSLFCKENCLTFVALIPLLLYFFTSLKVKKIIFTSIPYLVLVFVYLFIRSRVLLKMTFTNPLSVMANSLMAATNSADRIATSFVLLGRYIYMLIIPYPLRSDYSYNQVPIESWSNFKPILSLLVCIFLIGSMVWGIKKRSIYSFLIALFFITLLLSSNLIVKIASTFGERFLYVPSIGFCIALPILTARIFHLNPVQKVWKKKMSFYVLIACILAVYAVVVIPRNNEWRSNYTIDSADVITSPNNGRMHYFLALYLGSTAPKLTEPAMRRKYYSQAIGEFRRAIEIYYGDPDFHYSLGVCYLDEGATDSAIIEFNKTLELNPTDVRVPEKLGILYFNKAQYELARHYLLLAYQSDFGNNAALMNIGSSYGAEKNYKPAFYYFNLVLKKDPGNKTTRKNIAALHNNIGRQYIVRNKLDSALEEFNLALKYDSTSATILRNISEVYRIKENKE